MSLNIQAALGYLGVFIIGYGACLVRHAIPRGRLPPGGLEAVVNRQHRELQDVRTEIAEFKRQQERITHEIFVALNPEAYEASQPEDDDFGL